MFSSPWRGTERGGWKTYLAKNGSRLYKGNKKSIRLLEAQRAWWAVSGNKKGKSKRQPRGGVGDMELDALEKSPAGAPSGLFSGVAILAAQGCRAPRAVLQFSPRYPFKAVDQARTGSFPSRQLLESP